MHTGNPDYFNEDLARYHALQPNDIQAAVRRWLPADRRLELSVVPAEEGEVSDDRQRPGRSAASALRACGGPPSAQQAPDRSKAPATGPAPALKLPPIQKRALANGLPVWIVEMHEVPVVRHHA